MDTISALCFVTYDVLYTADVPKLNTQRYFEIQDKLSHRKMKIVPLSITFLEKKNGGCHAQGSSFVRQTLTNERTFEVQRHSRTNYLYIFRDFLHPVRLIWNYTTQISVGSELSPQGS